MVKISIVIPMYNEERYIRRCLDSLMHQTEQDIEVILVDDGSTDNTILIAKEYEKKMPLHILEQKHGGPGRARNLGAKIAQGDILVFVDADMSFDTNYIKELVKPIRNGDEAGTAHGREYVANRHHPIARAYGMIRLSYNEEVPRGGVFRAIKKDVFFSNTGYDDNRYAFEDDMGEKIGQALYVPTAICYHNNPESFREIFSHEVRIGESLIAKGMLREYLKKYSFYLSIVAISIVVAVLRVLYLDVPFTSLLITFVCIALFFLIIMGIQRAIKDRYASQLLYVPLVLCVRGAGYLTGIVKYAFMKH